MKKLEQLPIRTKIAIAARCCRRIEPVACNLPDVQREELRSAIDACDLYAKGTLYVFPSDSVSTLQKLEYIDSGTDSVEAVLNVAKALSSYDQANSSYAHLKHLNDIAETWARVGWHTAPATMHAALSAARRANPDGGEKALHVAAEKLKDAERQMNDLLLTCIEHSVAASAAGAAVLGGKASTDAARAASASATSDIVVASRLALDCVDPSESGPLGALWATYKPEFSVSRQYFRSYNSCFISYSGKDALFAERIHRDLQDKGVRCWFAPEDLKIGDKIRPAIDKSIHEHDKLLLVLSQQSVYSNWVEHEVEMALAREQQTGKIILFPIRLDDAVMKITIGWAAHVKNTRHIGDFRQWKSNDTYQAVFKRLLRDLERLIDV